MDNFKLLGHIRFLFVVVGNIIVINRVKTGYRALPASGVVVLVLFNSGLRGCACASDVRAAQFKVDPSPPLSHQPLEPNRSGEMISEDRQYNRSSREVVIKV